MTPPSPPPSGGIAGVFVHQRGRKYRFVRFVPDGVCYHTPVVHAAGRREGVINEVLAWFDRPAPPDRPPRRYTLAGSIVHLHHLSVQLAWDGADVLTPVGSARTTWTRAIAQSVDVNCDDAEHLEFLPGVGPGLARRILADREANGPFASVDDLARVRGLGPDTLARLAPFARV